MTPSNHGRTFVSLDAGSEDGATLGEAEAALTCDPITDEPEHPAAEAVRWFVNLPERERAVMVAFVKESNISERAVSRATGIDVRNVSAARRTILESMPVEAAEGLGKVFRSPWKA